MSSTRQLGTSGSLACSNSGAEANTVAARFIERNRLVSATLMDSSSSTTNTVVCNSFFTSVARSAGKGAAANVFAAMAHKPANTLCFSGMVQQNLSTVRQKPGPKE